MPKRGVTGGQLRLLSKSEVKSIHRSSLEVLERVGVQIRSEAILSVFQKSGAEVNLAQKNVRIPEHLVKEAVRKAPTRIVFAGRNPEFDILLEGKRVYHGLGGTADPYMADLETGEWIRPRKEHVAMATRLGDALPNIDVVCGLACASDVPPEVSWLHELATMLSNTQKPIVYSAAGSEGARNALAMAAAIAGGYKELEKRNIIAILSSFITPLRMDTQHENIIEFAKAKVPVVCGSGMMVGAATPITQAGAITVGNAEFLCAATLAELVNPGTPIMYCVESSNMDLRTGAVLYGHPERGISCVIQSQMAELYGVPTFTVGGSTDAKCTDAQAGLEVMATALMAGLAGINVAECLGKIGSGAAGSLEMAVVADEIVGYVNRILRGVQVDDETLAVDLIAKVGPGGHYLSQAHTRKFLQRGEFWMSELLDREPRKAWKRGTNKALDEVAREKAKRILGEHNPPALPRETQEEISRILRLAEKGPRRVT